MLFGNWKRCSNSNFTICVQGSDDGENNCQRPADQTREGHHQRREEILLCQTWEIGWWTLSRSVLVPWMVYYFFGTFFIAGSLFDHWWEINERFSSSNNAFCCSFVPWGKKSTREISFHTKFLFIKICFKLQIRSEIKRDNCTHTHTRVTARDESGGGFQSYVEVNSDLDYRNSTDSGETKHKQIRSNASERGKFSANVLSNEKKRYTCVKGSQNPRHTLVTLPLSWCSGARCISTIQVREGQSK